MPISKKRNTGISYKNDYIDIEFLLANLNAALTESATLLATNHVLRQVLLTTLVAIESGENHITEILILPYIEHVGKKEKWIISNLLNLGHDAHTIRYMLANSIKWNQKTCTLEPTISQVEYRRFMLFQKYINKTPPTLPITLEQFTGSINYDNCNKGLKATLSESDFDYSGLYGL